jgi:hypothetical protein
MRFGDFLGSLLGFGLTVSLCADAEGVGTRTFELDSLESFSGGALQGAAVGSDGVVRAGWTLGNVPLPVGGGATVMCAVALADGSVLVGTGPSSGGKVIRVASDQATLLADTKESAVSALVADGHGNVYAATTSNRVYRITRNGAALFATLQDVDSVLSLAVDPATGALFAGTGSGGKVMRITPDGAASVYFTSVDPFVVALAVGERGIVYAGTSGKGLLYRIVSPGRATVLYDFPGSDIRAVAVARNGVVYAVANEEPASGQETGAEASANKRTMGGRIGAGPVAAPRSKPGHGSLWRFDEQGRPERMMHHDEFHYASLALDEAGRPYVGTGAEGRVYTVDATHVVSLVADTTERQIGAMGLAGGSRFIVGSDPAVFHRIVSVGGPDSVWTSKPFDAGLRAHFGHATWRAGGTVQVSARTGDTQTPDATWSPWSEPFPDGAPVPTPPGRFVQVRARLLDTLATLSDVVVPFVTENLRAIVTDISARERGHELKEGLVPSGGGPAKHESAVHVSWKVDNPDGDELRYRVQFRRDGQTRWTDAQRPDDVLTKPELDWDTATLSEGKYRLRIEASDEMVNPLGNATRSDLVSAPVLVDNTPPVFQSLAMQGRRLKARVVDGLGPIVRIDVAIDGRTEFTPLSPVDGIFDTADESVDVDLTPLLVSAGSGPHIVAVRALDAAGNDVVRDVETP